MSNPWTAALASPKIEARPRRVAESFIVKRVDCSMTSFKRYVKFEQSEDEVYPESQKDIYMSQDTIIPVLVAFNVVKHCLSTVAMHDGERSSFPNHIGVDIVEPNLSFGSNGCHSQADSVAIGIAPHWWTAEMSGTEGGWYHLYLLPYVQIMNLLRCEYRRSFLRLSPIHTKENYLVVTKVSVMGRVWMARHHSENRVIYVVQEELDAKACFNLAMS